MKKCHKKPARGSYKEAKAIQQKNLSHGKSFFDYSEEEKIQIMGEAGKEGTKLMRETLKKYNHHEKI